MRLIQAKTILSPKNGVNLYRGCTHGCIYCDSRSVVYGIGEFEDIGVKIDAITTLRNELSRRRKKGMIYTGSMCDPYIPLESKLCLTQDMLKAALDFGFGVSILTKSDLALRDISLLHQINQKSLAVVCYTLTTFDDELCLRLEPNVVPTSVRLACLKEFASMGITTGVWMGPILPFINDNEENIKMLVKACHEVGVKFIIQFGRGVTMREGNREYFYNQLDQLFPNMKETYQHKFGENYICLSPNQRKLQQLFEQECKKYGILINTFDYERQFKHSQKVEQLNIFE
jgi:DNA repair photolyase